MNEEKYMKQAIKQALKAQEKDEVPIGCVIVKDDKIIARGYNLRQSKQQSYAHAEMIAIQKACKKLGTWRLEDCELYVTLEPCPMCSGAIMNARIKNIFYAVADKENGGHSRFNLFENSMNHSANCFHEKEFEQQNKKLIQDFFKNKRKLNKNIKNK